MFGMPQAAGERLAGSKQVRAARTRILNVLLDDLEPLADRAVAAIWAEIPAYGSKDERFAADVRDQVLRHYRANLHSFLEDRQVTERCQLAMGLPARDVLAAGHEVEDVVGEEVEPLLELPLVEQPGLADVERHQLEPPGLRGRERGRAG